jgi:UDP-glucose 4-epimerase
MSSAREKVTGQKIAVLEKPRRPGDPPRLIAGSEKVRAELGWKPQFQNVEKIIASAWAWHVRHPSGYGTSDISVESALHPPGVMLRR